MCKAPAGCWRRWALRGYRIKEVVEAVRSDEAMARKLWEVGKKVATYMATNDPAKAAELQAILGAAKASVSQPIS